MRRTAFGAGAFWLSATRTAVCPTPVHLRSVTSGKTGTAEDWDAGRYTTNAGFVPELGKPVVELLEPRVGEHILDVGCGDGVLTAVLQKKGCEVIGIDFAPNMVAAAVERNVEAYVMDAAAIDAPFLLSKLSRHDSITSSSGEEQGCQASSSYGIPSLQDDVGVPCLQPLREGFERMSNAANDQSHEDVCRAAGFPRAFPAFDAVFSNAALHWVKNPRGVIEGVKQVLRPGGRFVGEFGGHGNVAAIRTTLHSLLWRRGIDPSEIDPWYYPTVEEYRELLQEAGFIVDDIQIFQRPTNLPASTGMRGWLQTFAQTFLDALTEHKYSEPNTGGDWDSNRAEEEDIVNGVLDEALELLRPTLCDENGVWKADYVRLRFKAHLPHDCTSDTGIDVRAS